MKLIIQEEQQRIRVVGGDQFVDIERLTEQMKSRMDATLDTLDQGAILAVGDTQISHEQRLGVVVRVIRRAVALADHVEIAT